MELKSFKCLLDKISPLLCRWITSYFLIVDSKVAILGICGLGMMAVKYAIAFGAEVSIFARNMSKKKMQYK